MLLIALGAVLALVVGGGGLLLGMNLSKGEEPAAQPAPDQETVSAQPLMQDEPAATTEAPGPLANDELAEAHGASVFKVEVDGCQQEGWGSAWVLDEHHLVTNWHVVSVDPQPRLVSRDGETVIDGEVIGGQMEPDVAVIRVDEPLPDALPWAETDDLREGQEVVSLGYPAPAGDFSVTPSTIISFQKSGSTREAIRGDGALDRGNSGGPALTRDGEVAGVATLMVQEMGQLQMVPLLFTTDALRDSVEDILANPTQVEPECDADLPVLPDDWAPDFSDWAGEGPQSYGDDATLDQLQDQCTAGDLAACDELWWSSPIGSEYESFAMTCGGRFDEASYGTCEITARWESDQERWEAEQAEAEEEARRQEAEAEEQARQEEAERQSALDALTSACQGGDMQACDDLSYEAEYGSSAYQIADSCGGHYPSGWASCVDRAAEAQELQVLVGACQGGDMQACDDLWWAATSGTPEFEIADDCGGLYPGEGGMCTWQEESP